MGRFILRRLLWIVPVIFCVAIFVFTIMYFTPGDPARMIARSDATQEEINAIRAELGLNEPYFVQLGKYLYNAFVKFDLGKSYVTSQNVTEQLAQKLPNTLRIAAISICISILIGIPLGAIAATHQYTWKDNAAIFMSLFFVSMPSFWFALVLVQIFALKLGILPSMGIGTWKGYIMPCFALAIGGAASIARQTRSSMLEVIRQDYITMVRAKGQSEFKLTVGHILRNSLIPIITVIGSHMGTMMGGALIAETIFSIPGVGVYMVKAIGTRDYPVVRGGVLTISICFCLIMLLVDLVFAFVDPRIRTQFQSGTKKKKGGTNSGYPDRAKKALQA